MQKKQFSLLTFGKWKSVFFLFPKVVLLLCVHYSYAKFLFIISVS